jgi:hypothetical protein
MQMKKSIIFTIFLLAGLCLGITAKADTETLLQIGTPYNGSIMSNTPDQWYKYEVAENGKLDIDVAVATANQNIQIALLDPEKTMLGHWDANNTQPYKSSFGPVQAGTYYVRILAYAFPGTCSFTLSSSFDTADLEEDDEPNDLPAQAKLLDLNDSVSGHIGYGHGVVGYLGTASKLPEDQYDWWVVTLPDSGTLALALEQTRPDNLQLSVYAADGKTELYRNDTGGKPLTATLANMKKSSILVRIGKYAGAYTSYTLTDNFTPSLKTVDVVIKGKSTDLKSKPLLDGQNLLMTGSDLCRLLGATCSYNGKTKTATIKKGNIKITVKIGSKTASVNGKIQTMETTAKYTNTYMLPVKFLSTKLGFKYKLDTASLKAYIN